MNLAALYELDEHGFQITYRNAVRNMTFINIIRRAEEPRRADHEFSQNHLESGTSTEGRSIGGVRDKSAPTGG